MRSSIVNFCLVGLFLSVLFACSGEKRPANVLSAKDFEEVLYDYHLAQGMEATTEHDDSTFEAATDAALAKHHMTQADLDANFDYYSNHLDVLMQIYKQLNARYEALAGHMGVQMRAAANGENFSDSGDTVNVWTDSKVALLTHMPLECLKTFELQADTSYHMRDIFNLSGDVRFLGTKDIEHINNFTAGILVTYENDSVQTVVRTLSDDQRFLLQIHCDTLRPIKTVQCYMMTSSTTSRPILLQNLRLLKIHRKDVNIHKQERNDSIAQPEKPDLRDQQAPER